MGANWSTVRPWNELASQTKVDVDHWGYKPTAVPSQYIWHTAFNTAGGDTYMIPPFIGPNAEMALAGVLTDPLGAMGTGVGWTASNLLHMEGGGAFSTNFQQLNRPPGYAPYMEDRYPVNQQSCTPSTYPYCDMTNFTNWNASVTMWDHINEPNSVQAAVFDLPLRYYEMVDESTKAFMADKMDYVKDINSADTSNYDPCANNSLLLDVLGPLVTTTLTFISIQKYLLPYFDITDDSKMVIDIFFSSCVFFLSRHVLGVQQKAPIGEPGSNAWRAATLGTLGVLGLIGAYAGYWGYNNYYWDGSQELYEALGILFTNAFFIANMRESLDKQITDSKTGFIFSIIGTLFQIMRTLKSVFCRLFTADFDACNTAKTDETFKDARRWDVPSLVAAMTDEIISEQQLGGRDNPQAEFIYRGLLLNPSWAFAANSAGGRSPTVYEMYGGWNPIGELVQANYIQMLDAPQKVEYALRNYEGGMQQAKGINGEWDNTSEMTHTNTFACQNYEVLRNASQLNSDCIGCQVLSENMAKWMTDITESSYDKTKQQMQYFIKGIPFDEESNPLMSCIQYLTFCVYSYDRGGFDTVQERGEYAGFYTGANPLRRCSEEQLPFMTANNYYAIYPDLNSAAQILIKRANANQITWGMAYGIFKYLITEPYGIQQESWYVWVDHEGWNTDTLELSEGKKVAYDGPHDPITEKPLEPPKTLPPFQNLPGYDGPPLPPPNRAPPDAFKHLIPPGSKPPAEDPFKHLQYEGPPLPPPPLPPGFNTNSFKHLFPPGTKPPPIDPFKHLLPYHDTPLPPATNPYPCNPLDPTLACYPKIPNTPRYDPTFPDKPPSDILPSYPRGKYAQPPEWLSVWVGPFLVPGPMNLSGAYIQAIPVVEQIYRLIPGNYPSTAWDYFLSAQQSLPMLQDAQQLDAFSSACFIVLAAWDASPNSIDYAWQLCLNLMASPSSYAYQPPLGIQYVLAYNFVRFYQSGAWSGQAWNSTTHDVLIDFLTNY